MSAKDCRIWWLKPPSEFPESFFSLPEYIEGQFLNLRSHWRASPTESLGSCWIDPFMERYEPFEIPSSERVREVPSLRDRIGILIQASDVERVRGLPGLVTDLDLVPVWEREFFGHELKEHSSQLGVTYRAMVKGHEAVASYDPSSGLWFSQWRMCEGKGPDLEASLRALEADVRESHDELSAVLTPGFSGFEYRTTHGAAFDEGHLDHNSDWHQEVPPDDPVPPSGSGWEMTGCAATGDQLYWFWRRPCS